MPAYQNTFGENGLATYSDSDEHVLASNPIPDNCAGSIEFHIVARRVSNGAAKLFVFRTGFKRSTGAVTIFGLELLNTLGTVGDLIALALVAADVQANDDAIDLVISGLASVELDWGCITAGKYLQHVEE